MADTQATEQATTPAAPAAPAQTQDNNLNISQGKQDLIADQKRRRELIVKQNSTGGISPQEQEELNQLNKKLGKDSGGKATIKNDKKLAKDPKEETEEPKDIFKEDDILNYMYNNWLLAGANWLFKKSYKGVDWLAGKTAKGLWKAAGWAGSEAWEGLKKGYKNNIKPLFNKEPPRDDAMTRFATALNNTHQASLASKAETITGHLAEFGETLKRFSEGNITEEDKKTHLYALYQKVPENKRKSFCESMFTQATNATQNSLEIHRMAERLVSLRNLQSAMSNPNPQPLSPEMYKREVNLMALVVARSISQSKKPIKAMGMLSDNIQKSEQMMQAVFVNGNYKANGKNPEDNKKLNNQLGDTFKSVGLDSNGLITKEKEDKLQKYAYNDPNSKKDMLERLVMEQVAYSKIAQRQENLQGQEAALAQRYKEYQAGKTNPLKRIYGLYAQRGDNNIETPVTHTDEHTNNPPQPQPRPRAGNDGR